MNWLKRLLSSGRPATIQCVIDGQSASRKILGVCGAGLVVSHQGGVKMILQQHAVNLVEFHKALRKWGGQLYWEDGGKF